MSAPTDMASAAQALAAALLAAIVDPADAIRLLSSLADFVPDAPTTSAPIGQAMATMQDATGDLCRRAAVVALARASSTYQPASYDDALAVRDTVCALIDAEIDIAGDQGEDATYNAFRALRTAVAQDLIARGADLSPMKTVETPMPMPALVLAQRLYQDAGRTDELVTEADPVHPAFMPTSFRALSQ